MRFGLFPVSSATLNGFPPSEVPMSDTLTTPAALPLTQLNEDEQLFRSTVREFAQKSIGPLVRQMDEEQHFSADLLPQL